MREEKSLLDGDGLCQLSNTLFRVYSGKKWTPQWGLYQLVRNWQQVVGSQVAQLTTPAYFRHDVLWIFVQNSAWMQHMQYVKLDLLERVNKALEGRKVSDIRWLLQSGVPVEDERQVLSLSPIDPLQEQAFCRMAETVASAECREALCGLWKSHMSHRKREP